MIAWRPSASRLLVPALAFACLAAAGAAAARPPATVTVYAASSLADVFPAIDPSEQYSFGGSNALATQIESGAPADVFASANTTIPAQLYAKGLVGKPVRFTRNALVLVVPKGNPGAIHSVYDLTKAGTKIDVANSAVPVGSYTLQALAKLSLTTKVMANVVSKETDVRGVLAKVALGQADAGFVYATDAQTVLGKVTVIRLPARAQPTITYAIAVVTKSAHPAAARAFIAKVLSKAGQAQLSRRGFLPLAPPAPAMRR